MVIVDLSGRGLKKLDRAVQNSEPEEHATCTTLILDKNGISKIEHLEYYVNLQQVRLLVIVYIFEFGFKYVFEPFSLPRSRVLGRKFTVPVQFLRTSCLKFYLTILLHLLWVTGFKYKLLWPCLLV